MPLAGLIVVNVILLTPLSVVKQRQIGQWLVTDLGVDRQTDLCYNRRVGQLRQTKEMTMSENEQTELDKAMEAAEKKAAETNAARTGVGTRVQVGKTRGKNPVVITYEQFDDAVADSLPKSIEQFMEVTGNKDEPTLVDFLIRGKNAALYEAASDPLAEFVEPTWPDESKTQFRIVVRNYSRGAGVSIDDAVALIKPGFVAQFGPK